MRNGAAASRGKPPVSGTASVSRALPRGHFFWPRPTAHNRFLSLNLLFACTFDFVNEKKNLCIDFFQVHSTCEEFCPMPPASKSPKADKRTKWCTCQRICSGGAYVHPRTYNRHKDYRDAVDSSSQGDYGIPNTSPHVKRRKRKAKKVRNYSICTLDVSNKHLASAADTPAEYLRLYGL